MTICPRVLRHQRCNLNQLVCRASSRTGLAATSELLPVLMNRSLIQLRSPDPWVTEMITGKTVGVEPWSADRSAQALLARLRTLTQSTCSSALLWITDAGICSDLVGAVNQAESFRSSGQMMSTRTSLVHFQTLISKGRAAGRVNSSAYWLLKANSDIVYGLI